MSPVSSRWGVTSNTLHLPGFELNLTPSNWFTITGLRVGSTPVARYTRTKKQAMRIWDFEDKIFLQRQDKGKLLMSEQNFLLQTTGCSCGFSPEVPLHGDPFTHLLLANREWLLLMWLGEHFGERQGLKKQWLGQFHFSFFSSGYENSGIPLDWDFSGLLLVFGLLVLGVCKRW